VVFGEVCDAVDLVDMGASDAAAHTALPLPYGLRRYADWPAERAEHGSARG